MRTVTDVDGMMGGDEISDSLIDIGWWKCAGAVVVEGGVRA